MVAATKVERRAEEEAVLAVVSRREPRVSRREPRVSRREPRVSRREPRVSRREPRVSRRAPPSRQGQIVKTKPPILTTTEKFAEYILLVRVVEDNNLHVVATLLQFRGATF